jgi:hypothetical protein
MFTVLYWRLIACTVFLHQDCKALLMLDFQTAVKPTGEPQPPDTPILRGTVGLTAAFGIEHSSGL